MRLLPWRKSKAGTVPALFLHIQKTAGTSLINQARQYYGSSIISHGDFCKFLPDQLEGIRFVSGHFGYSYARHLMAGRYSFTFLRDPAERILSFYYFCRGRDPTEYPIFRLAQEYDLAGFLDACLSEPFLKMHVWNNQVWQLAYGYTQLDTRTLNDFAPSNLMELAKKHLDEFSFVGFTESFPADARDVCRALDYPRKARKGKLTLANVTPHRPSLMDQTGDARRQLARLTELDREFYEHARAKRAADQRARSRRWSPL